MHKGREQHQSLEVKEEKRRELLKQGKGWDAIQYALAERLPFGDTDIFAAMQAIIDAQDRAEVAGNEAELSRLQDEYEHISKWRLGE